MSTSLNIRGEDRAAFVGKTGSGKTYAAGVLSRDLPRLVVCDPKGTLRGRWGLSEWTARTRRALRRGEPVRVRVPAPFGNDWEPIFGECYAAQNLTVYIDETYGVTHNGAAGPWLTALYTRGRELHIGVWAATQRPRKIPLFVLSEAEWTLCFRLRLQADREYMAEQIGGEVAATKLTGHQFFLCQDEWDEPVLYTRING